MSSKNSGVFGLIFLATIFFGGYVVGSYDNYEGVGTCWPGQDDCVEMYKSNSGEQLYSLTDGVAVNCHCINVKTKDLKECHHDRLVCDVDAVNTCQRRLGSQYKCAMSLNILESE